VTRDGPIVALAGGGWPNYAASRVSPLTFSQPDYSSPAAPPPQAEGTGQPVYPSVYPHSYRDRSRANQRRPRSAQ
jgi:hypothetical protein